MMGVSSFWQMVIKGSSSSSPSSSIRRSEALQQRVALQQMAQAA